ncbi:MAG: restriction endonuclease [Dactylosporangium sp.]|nr:HNH endonuclease [Dactylosporangium sp.]NNJ60166.1 restriction endonuclease [Dactylosporangium sp.]
MTERGDGLRDQALARLAALRPHQRNGRRSPHKPLLVLLALGRLAVTGSSALGWQDAQVELGNLIAEFGPASKTSRVQGAAYPFTRLRSDGVWVLDHDVPMDILGPLSTARPTGRFAPAIEQALAADPVLIVSAARVLVEAHFPATIAPDVLAAVGFDPDAVLHAPSRLPEPAGTGQRQRDPKWRDAILQAWDRQCAFCGFDGQVHGATVGVDAAHVRWFALDGPDSLDNGLALCVLHHRLFDHGVLGLDNRMRVCVSGTYSSRTVSGQAVYDLNGHRLRARPGTPLPAVHHVAWHHQQVFKGQPLAVSSLGSA